MVVMVANLNQEIEFKWSGTVSLATTACVKELGRVLLDRRPLCLSSLFFGFSSRFSLFLFSFFPFFPLAVGHRTSVISPPIVV